MGVGLLVSGEATAWNLLNKESERLKSYSYCELLRIANEHTIAGNDIIQWIASNGAEYLISIVVSRLGRIRKRICVEITVTGDDWEHWSAIPCCYFELYESGELIEDSKSL